MASRGRRRIDPEAMLDLYRHGAFPMGDETGRHFIVAPDPRTIIPLDGFHVSKTLAQRIRSRRFPVTFDQAFGDVVRACAGRSPAWITPELEEAYAWLHEGGHAHSVEAWREGELVGGAFGLSIAGAFFAESMFHRATDAGMVALATLIARLQERGFALFDVQFTTEHLARSGAIEISRDDYLRRLETALALPVRW